MAVERLEVVFRSDAADDLDAIYRWIYEASLEPVTAQRYLDRIVAFCEKIAADGPATTSCPDCGRFRSNGAP